MQDLKRLWPYIRPSQMMLVGSMILLFGSAILEGAILVLLEPIFNAWQKGPAAATEGTFGPLVAWLGIAENLHVKIPVLMVVLALTKGVFLYLAEYSMSGVGQRVVASLRSRLHRHLLGQSMAFYISQPTGQLMARLITDTERIQQTVSRTLSDFGRQSIIAVVFLGILFTIDWQLTLVTFLLVPPVAWITTKLGNRLRSVALRSQQNLSDISEAVQETITGQRIVKAFAMEDYEQSRFERLLARLVHNNLKVARINALNAPVIEVIGYIAFAPLLVYANYRILQGGTGGEALSLGSLALFVTSLIRLYDPVRKLSRIHLHFQQAFASSARIFEILDTHDDIREDPRAKALAPIERRIDFEDVSLHYRNNPGTPALQDVNLTIRKGEMVALVGSSGAGKTSLAGLIPRFYDTTSGTVSIDGIDVRRVTLRSLRLQVAMVTQETFLFNDSIANNISYGNKGYAQDEVEEAAKAAYIHDFIVGLPGRYATVVGERGGKLSGGQRQRIAIARAVLKKAPLLILDEATSSLDSESERLVQKALYNLMRQTTTLVIAHRLSTVRRADRIVVMRAGRVVEVGDHESLLETCGEYQRLHALQFGD